MSREAENIPMNKVSQCEQKEILFMMSIEGVQIRNGHKTTVAICENILNIKPYPIPNMTSYFPSTQFL